MRDYRNVLFDLDGTLVDSAPGIVQAYTSVACAMDRQPPAYTTILGFIGNSLFENLSTFIPPDRVQEAAEMYFTYYDEHRLGLVENSLFEGISDLLYDLRSYDLRLYLLTAKLDEFVRPILNMFGLEQYFDGIVAGDRNSMSCSKKDLLPIILEKNQLKAEECVLVTDRGIDVGPAHDVGVDAICVTWGYGDMAEVVNARPEYIVHTMSELLEIFVDSSDRIRHDRVY